jgi:hypothetical protein
MTEIRPGIPETQIQKAKVIDLQAVRRERLTEGRQAQAPKIQPETPPKEGSKEPILSPFPTEKPVSPEKEQTRFAREETETREGLAAVREKLREEQQIGEETSPVTGEIAAFDPNRRDQEQREWFAGKREAPPGKMKVDLDKDSYTFIDTPEEKARKRDNIPQEERQRLTEVVDAFGSRPLTEDEWKTVERSNNLKDFFATLDDADRSRLGHKQEELEKGMTERFRERFKERMNGYPDWWKVYDKDGNRVFKMSLPDKALLAKWKEFDGLAPSEQMAILKEFADTHIPKDEKESFGEKFAKVIDYLVEFLIALFKSTADAEETPAQKAA